MRKPSRKLIPWWQAIDMPPFPAAPWEIVRDHETGAWIVTSEALDGRVVARMPIDSGTEAEHKATALLIAAAPVLFMGAASHVRLVDQNGNASEFSQNLDLLRLGLDLARGRA